MTDHQRPSGAEPNSDIASRVMSALDSLPANLPVSFFTLIHGMGFVEDDRDELHAAIETLTNEGMILRPLSMDGMDLSTPLRSARLERGRSTIQDASTVFGAPSSRKTHGEDTILVYPLHPRHPQLRKASPDTRSPLDCFRLIFNADDILVRIENHADEGCFNLRLTSSGHEHL